jgi:hypothetical protein
MSSRQNPNDQVPKSQSNPKSQSPNPNKCRFVAETGASQVRWGLGIGHGGLFAIWELGHWDFHGEP